MIQLLFLVNLILKVSTQAVIEVDPYSQTVDRYGTARMRCKVRDATDVYWEIRTQSNAFMYHILRGKTKHKTWSQFSSKISWDLAASDPKQFDLIIGSVDKNDQGVYICRAKGIDNILHASKPAELSVKYPEWLAWRELHGQIRILIY